MQFRSTRKRKFKPEVSRYRFCMTVITSNFELEEGTEADLDPEFVLFDEPCSNERIARHRAMELFRQKTASGALPAEFRLYRVEANGTLTPIELLTPRISHIPFSCEWQPPRVEMIRGAA